MTEREETMYSNALAFATQKHSGQLRIGGAPYITHPATVSKLVREGGYGLNYQLTALFHDLLEDTNATKAEIASQEFKRRYILETLEWYMDFSLEIPKAVKELAQLLTPPMTELSFLYEPVKTWIMLDSING